MKKKLMMLAMALGLSVAALTGCGKPTLESLVDGMYDNEIGSQTAEVDMDIVLSLAAQGVSVDVSIDGDFEMQSSGLAGDAEQMHYMDGKLNLNVGGQSQSKGFEMYMLREDDTVTNYVYNEDTDTWHKAETEAVSLDQDTLEEMTENIKDILKENGELADDTEDVNGEECYVITAVIDGDDIVSLLEPFKGTIDDAMENANVKINPLSWFKYFSMDATYYISKDTGYLVSSEIDMADSDLYGMFEQIMKDTGLDASGVMDAIENISFSEFKVNCVMSDINETEVVIPKDVIEDAVLGGAGSLDGIISSGTVSDPDINDPDIDAPDIDDPDIDDPDPVTTDEWYDGESFILNKSDESDEFLCRVNIPNGYSYDEEFSHPDEGIVSLDRVDGEGYIWVQNFVSSPMYYALLNDGVLPVDEYSDLESCENYNMDMKVIGTAFGGSDVILAAETYTREDSEVSNVYICIKYSDGGYNEFLAVDCNSVSDLDDWKEDDFLKLAVDLFGR